MVYRNFVQPVLMTGERTFDLLENTSVPGAIDDITSNIAWEIIEKRGRVIFTEQIEVADLGRIVLKTRF